MIFRRSRKAHETSRSRGCDQLLDTCVFSSLAFVPVFGAWWKNFVRVDPGRDEQESSIIMPLLLPVEGWLVYTRSIFNTVQIRCTYKISDSILYRDGWQRSVYIAFLSVRCSRERHEGSAISKIGGVGYFRESVRRYGMDGHRESELCTEENDALTRLRDTKLARLKNSYAGLISGQAD